MDTQVEKVKATPQERAEALVSYIEKKSAHLEKSPTGSYPRELKDKIEEVFVCAEEALKEIERQK